MSDSRQQFDMFSQDTGLMQPPEVFNADRATKYRSSAQPITYTADEFPGYPCRQCLRDAEIGDELILVSFDPFTRASPYRQSSPIFLHRTDCSQNRDEALVPQQLVRRLLSVRAFDEAEMMIDAAVLQGTELVATIEKFADNAATAFIDIHNATRGCWAARYRLV